MGHPPYHSINLPDLAVPRLWRVLPQSKERLAGQGPGSGAVVMKTIEELRQLSNIAARRLTPQPNSEEPWRLAAKQWRKSGYIVPCKRKYQPR